MKKSISFLLLIALVLYGYPASGVSFHKKKKDYGVVDPNSIGIEIGILTGATAEDLIESITFRTSRSISGGRDNFDDFEDGPTLNLSFRRQTQPKFAFGFDGSYTRLSTKSSAEGVNLMSRRVITDKEFSVDLFSVAAMGYYFFQTTDQSTFRVFLGGGFGFYLADQSYSDVQTFPDSLVAPGVADSREITDSQTDTALGVVGILGLEYFFDQSYSLLVRGKGQIVQSAFSLPIMDGSGNILNENTVVNFSGVVLMAGIGRHF